MMQSSPLAIVTMRRDLSARYASTTRQWLAARNAYRRLHEQPGRGPVDGIRQGRVLPQVAPGDGRQVRPGDDHAGLPEQLGFELVEPLRDLFKDEVRKVGEALGLPEKIVWRHPFPGPGLAVRVVGDVTPERLRILRDADEIVLEELIAADLSSRAARKSLNRTPVLNMGGPEAVEISAPIFEQVTRAKHQAGALKHQFLDRHAELARMGLGRTRG